jgi:hypothetical protein
MSRDQVIVFLCGIHSLGFAVFPIAFWRIFGWKSDLGNISVVNRAILQIANLRLIYLFFVIAAACFFVPNDLLTTRLGHLFLGGMSLFWVGRLIEQFIFLRYNRAMIHFLSLLFLFGAILFAMPILP